MKRFLMIVFLMFSSLMLVAQVEAKRLGSGKNTGTQRNVATQQQAPQPAPAMNQQMAQPQKSGMSKWLGPLAGLALGAGLFALLSSMGLDGALGGILLALLVGGIIMAVVMYFLRKKAKAAAGLMQQGGMNYATANAAPQQQSAPQQQAGSSLWSSVQSTATPSQTTANTQPAGSSLWSGMANTAPAPKVPAGFPVDAFLNSAKSVFTRLQAANDRKDLNDLRDFTTPAMYAEIAAEIQQRGYGIQKTEVMSLNASIIEVVTEGSLAVASVRFTGQIRENGGFAEAFDEIWHVQQDLNDKNAAWLLCGIQQTVTH